MVHESQNLLSEVFHRNRNLTWDKAIIEHYTKKTVYIWLSLCFKVKHWANKNLLKSLSGHHTPLSELNTVINVYETPAMSLFCQVGSIKIGLGFPSFVLRGVLCVVSQALPRGRHSGSLKTELCRDTGTFTDFFKIIFHCFKWDFVSQLIYAVKN